MVIKELKKYLLLVAFLLSSKEAFALISREDLVEALSSVIPKGYFDVAAILQISGPGPWGGLILFFATAALGLGLFWIAINKIFANELTNNSTLQKAAILISASFGIILAYGIGMLAAAFYILIGISTLVVMFFIGVAAFRAARGFAAGVGKYEAELRKAELEVRSSLMKVETAYQPFKQLSEKLFKGRRVPQYLWLKREESLFERLLKDIERLQSAVNEAIRSGDTNRINNVLNEVKIKKQELQHIIQYFEKELKQQEQQGQQPTKEMMECYNMLNNLISWLEHLEASLNSLEQKLKGVQSAHQHQAAQGPAPPTHPGHQHQGGQIVSGAAQQQIAAHRQQRDICKELSSKLDALEGFIKNKGKEILQVENALFRKSRITTRDITNSLSRLLNIILELKSGLKNYCRQLNNEMYVNYYASINFKLGRTFNELLRLLKDAPSEDISKELRNLFDMVNNGQIRKNDALIRIRFTLQKLGDEISGILNKINTLLKQTR